MIERKCLSCGTWNQNEDFCKQCGNPISPLEINRADAFRKKLIEEQKPKDAFDRFAEKLKNHRYLTIRIFYKIGYSITVLFGAIGAFFAWIVAMANG